MKLMILNKVVGHNKKKIDNSKTTWEDWKKKIVEEVDELIDAIREKDRVHMVEEVLDILQCCIGILAKLAREGVSIDQGIHLHNKKLIDRGCEPSAEINIRITKRI